MHMYSKITRTNWYTIIYFGLFEPETASGAKRKRYSSRGALPGARRPAVYLRSSAYPYFVCFESLTAKNDHDRMSSVTFNCKTSTRSCTQYYLHTRYVSFSKNTRLRRTRNKTVAACPSVVPGSRPPENVTRCYFNILTF